MESKEGRFAFSPRSSGGSRPFSGAEYIYFHVVPPRAQEKVRSVVANTLPIVLRAAARPSWGELRAARRAERERDAAFWLASEEYLADRGELSR
jgi:hypothetical protein